MGYLRSMDGERFEWNCHEAVTQADALITPRYIENSEGVVLVKVGDLAQARDTDESMYRTEDGCNWTPPDGLTGQQIEAMAFDPNDETVALAVTANEEGANRVFRSDDAGLTWSPTDLVIEDRMFRSIRFARGSANAVWASAVRYESEEAWIYHSTDGGNSWSEHPVDVVSAGGLDVYVDVLVADATDPNTAWVVMGPYVDDRLLETTDGGASFTEVYALNGDIIDGAQDAAGDLWLVTTGNYVVHRPVGGDFTRVEHAPLSIGVETDSTRLLVATRVPGEGTAMAVSSDGSTFDPVYVFGATTGPPVCLPESDAALICSSRWAALSDIISGDGETDTAVVEDTAAPSPPKATTGCCSGDASHSSAGLVFLTLLGVGRRRTST